MTKKAIVFPEARRCINEEDPQFGWIALQVPNSRAGWLVGGPDGAHWATEDEVKDWKVLT